MYVHAHGIGGRGDRLRRERDHRQISGTGHSVIHESRGQKLAVFVIDHPFLHRLTNALGDPAVHLPFGEHRVDQIAEIIDHRVAVDGHNARFRINHHLGHMRPVGIAAPRQAGAFIMG